MAMKQSRSAARLMMAPAVILLPGWMLVPLCMTLYFAFKKYLPLRGGDLGGVGFENYPRFVTSPAFWLFVQTTPVIVGGVFAITVILGVLLAILLDQPMWGQRERSSRLTPHCTRRLKRILPRSKRPFPRSALCSGGNALSECKTARR